MEMKGARNLDVHTASRGLTLPGLAGVSRVLPEKEHEHLPKFPLPDGFDEQVKKVLADQGASIGAAKRLQQADTLAREVERERPVTPGPRTAPKPCAAVRDQNVPCASRSGRNPHESKTACPRTRGSWRKQFNPW